MKCLTCLHYDVVNLECKHLADKFGLKEPVSTAPNWGCKDYKSATADNILDKISIKIDIGI